MMRDQREHKKDKCGTPGAKQDSAVSVQKLWKTLFEPLCVEAQTRYSDSLGFSFFFLVNFCLRMYLTGGDSNTFIICSLSVARLAF